MLRVLALLCSLALLMVPFGPVQAEPACAMLAATQGHSVHGSDHQMPSAGHPAQTCKQLCAVVGILAPPEPLAARPVVVLPAPRPVARLFASLPAAPSERPPKRLV